MNKKIIALLGPAGSGKDSILKAVCELRPEWKRLIPITSRPARENEKQGDPYLFLADETFRNMIVTNHLAEYQCFNGWWYGTEQAQIEDGINIGCFSPAAARALKAKNEFDVYIIYIKVADKQRLLRQLNREDTPNCYEICRRFQTDTNDFQNLEDLSPIVITNENGQFATAVSNIVNFNYD